mmetsp:Transcript_38254/g.49473  ORF Transcript_38254/g.49473 Transcript_38254/m.49473 type:complete len:180 (+) Transcript_38254:100-639(+)
MPKTPIDYSKTVIYKLQHNDDESLLYVGSTTDFTRRKSQHKSDCNNENSTSYNQKKYQMIRSNGGWDAFTMIEIEKFPCRDSRQAHRREDELIREMKSNMNMIKANREIEEIKEYNKQYKKNWNIENKEEIKEYHKQYRIDNQETIAERITCECGCISRRDSIARHKKTQKHISLMNSI